MTSEQIPGEKTPGRQRLVAVVTTYNRLDQLKQTLARLLEAPADELQAVVVVDNASTDGTGAWLAAQDDPRLIGHRSPRNMGGAGGFETGMRLAVDRLDPDWIVVMDDDARPAPGALAAFHARPRPDGVAVAAAVYYPDGRICEMNRPSVNPFWNPRMLLRSLRRGRDGYHIPYADYDAAVPRPIDLTSFVGLFLSRRILREVGLPHGKLFLYGDDVIYTLRLRRLGLEIAFDPAVRFEHDCSTFEDDRHRRVFRPLWKVYYTYRNGLIMYHRAAGPLFWPLLPLWAVKWRLAAGRYGADRATYLRLYRRALWDAVRDRVERSHDEVLALAGEPVSGSGSRGDTGPAE